MREWLGAMVTGGIVEYDAARRRYRLPPEHAASLTREARARTTSPRPRSGSRCSASVEDQVLDCFEQRRRRALRAPSSASTR